MVWAPEQTPLEAPARKAYEEAKKDPWKNMKRLTANLARSCRKRLKYKL